MKIDVEAEFVADYRRLTKPERARFQHAIRAMNEAYAQRGDRAMPHWPSSLQIKRLRDFGRFCEMTWSFAGQDGRATFEFITNDDELAIRRRRIGGRSAFDRP